MINTTRIDELREEVGAEELDEVIALFCEEMEEVLSNLDNTPPEGLAGQIHFLKGSALNVGLDGLCALCRAEELRLRADPASVPDIAAIRNAYAEARPLLLRL